MHYLQILNHIHPGHNFTDKHKKQNEYPSTYLCYISILAKAIGIKKGDEVIIPNFTIISNALAVIKLGATPILVDCTINNWNMNINHIKKK